MHPNPPPPYYSNLESGQNRNIPQYPSKYKKRSCAGGCCRCICCCCCFLFVIILISFIVLFSLYRVYDPKFPIYKVESLEVKSFDILPDFSLNTEIQLSVRAENPNKKVTLNYGDDNWVDISYMETSLCSGKVPAFQQGHQNTTIITVDLKGNSNLGTGLQQTFSDSRKSHRIPLLVKLRVPVSLVFGETPTRQFKAFVVTHLVLDNIAPNTPVGIISKDTTVRFDL